MRAANIEDNKVDTENKKSTLVKSLSVGKGRLSRDCEDSEITQGKRQRRSSSRTAIAIIDGQNDDGEQDEDEQDDEDERDDDAQEEDSSHNSGNSEGDADIA